MNRTHLTGLIMLTLATMLALCLKFTHGPFFYTLDDPYIHLTLAQRIFGGEYGLNAGEFASPSSSVLWPFLLAPFMGFSWAAWVPLGINSLCLVATGRVMQRALARTQPKMAALITYGLLLVTNTFGLVFTGMEHSLQVLFAVMITAGLMELRDGIAPRGLMLALIVAPLVRYEMLGFSALAIGLLLRWGHGRYLWAGVIFTIILSAFSFFLWRQSGEWLPASVMGKISFYRSPAGNQLLLAALAGCALRFAWLIRAQRAACGLLVWAALIVVVQLGFGKNGWFNRYEVYALAAAGLVLAEAAARHVAIVRQKPAACMLLGVTLVLTGYWYGATTLHTPMASRCIALQHGQMRRLADLAGNPAVAVNDIGVMGFRNPSPVFDLFGLGQWSVRKLLLAHPDEVLAQVRARNIPLVMLYPDWFTGIPRPWVKLGTLRQPDAKANGCGVAGEEVAIYASDPRFTGALTRAISQWQTDLPPEAIWIPAAPE